MEEEKSIFDILLDENDDSNVVLINEKEEEVEFEQIAIVPLKEEVYAILKPVKPIPGVNEGEGLVFKLTETDEGEQILIVEGDDDVIDVVFDVYEKMFNDKFGNEEQ